MPNPKNAKLHSLWQESQCDFADTTWRRTSALKIGLPAMQRILATRQRVMKIFALLKSNALFNAFLREEGGTRLRDGRSLRGPHFFACFITTAFPKLRALPQSPAAPAFGPGRKHGLLPALAKNMPPAYFLNASRPPGGSLSHKHILR